MATLSWKKRDVLCTYVKPALLIVVTLCLISATGCSKSRTEGAKAAQSASDTDESPGDYPDFQEPDDTQSAVSFYGWLGDSAVLTEEVYTDEDSSFAEYYLFRPGKDDMEPLEMDDSMIQKTGVVVGGIEVAPLHGMNPKEPYIELHLDYDSTALADMKATLETLGESDELPEPVPSLVGVIWHQPEISVDTLWLDTVFVGAYFGDTAIECHLPEVTYAEMSPSRRSLMVALWLNDYIEYFVFDLSGLKKG